MVGIVFPIPNYSLGSHFADVCPFYLMPTTFGNFEHYNWLSLFGQALFFSKFSNKKKKKARNEIRATKTTGKSFAAVLLLLLCVGGERWGGVLRQVSGQWGWHFQRWQVSLVGVDTALSKGDTNGARWLSGASVVAAHQKRRDYWFVAFLVPIRVCTDAGWGILIRDNQPATVFLHLLSAILPWLLEILASPDKVKNTRVLSLK